MKILLKIRLKKQYIFISAQGCQMDPEIDEKGGPIKRCISRVRPQKHENLRHFRESIAKLLEKTRVFDVPGPLGPSKRPKSHLDHNLIVKWSTRGPKTRKNTVFLQSH